MTSVASLSLACLYGMTELVLPQSVTYAGKGFAKDCPALERVILPSGLKDLPARAFMMCERLREVNLTSVERIGQLAMFETAVSSIAAPGLTAIGDAAFLGCSLIRYLETPSLVSLGRLSFYRCSGLQKVVLPATIETLSFASFGYCMTLREVEILSESLTVLDEDAFLGCERVLIKGGGELVRGCCLSNGFRYRD